MTDAINTNNRLKAPVQAPDSREQKPASSDSKQAANNPASAVVELSSEQLLDQVQQAPEIDKSRVESIKAAIANGQYKPNAEVIAQKFAEIEQLLP